MNVVLGVCGSIAAYKACEIVSRLKKAGCEVRVIMTKNAAEFVSPLTFETLSSYPVCSSMFGAMHEYEVEHIALAKWADVFLVAPASANFIAKYACGIADDMLTTTALATRAKVVVAPAMNTNMYEHITMTENMRTLKNRGVIFVEPGSGLLACGDTGKGRLSEPVEIVEFVKGLAHSADLTGKTIMVTAGATKERLDPVRYLTNRSTGKMGAAIANAAYARGARVILVCGDIDATVAGGIEREKIVSTADMLACVTKRIDECDALICAAAPADFTPKNVSDTKIKKHGDMLTLELAPTVDILKTVGMNKGSRVHIGFAAETNDVEAFAKEKLEKKNLDAIAANDVTCTGCGFGVDTNAVTLYKRNGDAQKSGLMKKEELAHWLLDIVSELMSEGRKQ